MIMLISLFSFTFFLLQISEPVSKIWKDHLSSKLTNVYIKRPKQVYHNQNNYTKSLNNIPSVEEHITFKIANDVKSDIGKSGN